MKLRSSAPYALGLLMLASLAACNDDNNSYRFNTLDGQKPIVIGHRGTAGHMPDHTLEGYQKAIDFGVDFVEPDLVATKDGVLIARHEPNITGTTNVKDHPEFASRKRTKHLVDGAEEDGWFASDFTLAEIKTLRAIQPFADRDQSFNGKFQIPTLDEILTLVQKANLTRSQKVGVYIETKHPTYHKALNLPLEDRLLASLTQFKLTEKDSPVILQSFESGNLKYLRTKTKVRLVQLIDGNDVNADGSIDFSLPWGAPYDYTAVGDKRNYGTMVTPEGLKAIKTYADGIGPWKPYLISSKQVDKNNDGKPDDLNGDGVIDERDRVMMAPTEVLKNAHAAGLFVHPYTFRSEAKRLASDFAGDPLAEYMLFYKLGVDGVFSDQGDDAIKALKKL